MKSGRTLVYATVVVMVLLALGVYRLTMFDPGKVEPVRPVPATTQVAETASPAAAKAPVAPPLDPTKPARALPPPGTLADLTAKAGAGDAIAACQLAAELADCRTRALFRRHTRGNEPEPMSPRCEQLLAGHVDRHFELLRQAANAGEPEAMLRYAMGEGFGISGDSFSYLRSPHFDTWRREAPSMLQSLLEAGYPEAVIYRMMANDSLMGGPMANLIQPDAVQDRAYGELLLLLSDDADFAALMRLRNRAGADDLVTQQARQQAERWHQEHFRGQTFDFALLESETELGFPLMRAHGQNCSVAVGESTP